MKPVELAIDVLCDWLGYPPAYRVYVDDDLITERTYAWNNDEQYVREHILVELGAGTHSLVIEAVASVSSQSTFKTSNFTVDGHSTAIVNNTFTI